MKTITKEIKKVEVITQYESFDGQVWDKKEDCEKWERSYEASVKRMMMAIPQTEEMSAEDYLVGYGCNDSFKIYYVRDENDIKVINAYLDIYSLYSARRVELKHIGKHIMICEYYENDMFLHPLTLQEYVVNIQENINKLIETIPQMPNEMKTKNQNVKESDNENENA